MLNVIHLLLAALLGANTQAVADPDPAPHASPSEGVRVVELFTSQGCPMCPSANELLEEIATEDAGILALAYGVAYWDVYGWQDTFAMPEFGDRQQDYVDAGDARRVYTPHFVINGSAKKLRFSEERVTAAIEESPALPVMVSAQQVGDRIEIRLAGAERYSPAQIWAVAYHAGRETVTPDEGPNAGREVSHYNMVRAIESAGEWSGGDLMIELEAPGETLAAAILVQDGRGGPIITAARVERP